MSALERPTPLRHPSGHLGSILTALFTATRLQRIAVAYGRLLPPTRHQIRVFLAIQYGGLALISLVALLVLWRVWARAGRNQTPA